MQCAARLTTLVNPALVDLHFVPVYSEPRVKNVVTILTADASDIEGQTPLLVITLEEACAANPAAEIVPADHRPRYEAI
jgi:hypothetical protein